MSEHDLSLFLDNMITELATLWTMIIVANFIISCLKSLNLLAFRQLRDHLLSDPALEGLTNCVLTVSIGCNKDFASEYVGKGCRRIYSWQLWHSDIFSQWYMSV
jgi:hypothetical protein